MPPVNPTNTGEEPQIATGRFQPLVSLRTYYWLTLLILIAGAPTSYLLATRIDKITYATSAVVLISPNFASNLEARDLDLRNSQQYLFYVRQQESIVTRDDVLQETLKNPQVREFWLEKGEEEERALQRLRTAITTQTSPNQNPFMRIRIQSDKHRGLEVIVNQVTEIYLRKSRSENIYDSSGRITSLQKREDELLKFIEEKRTEVNKIGAELGVTTFRENSLNPYDQILIESTLAYNNARRLRLEAETQLQALQTDKKGNTILDSLIQEQIATDMVHNNLISKLHENKLTLENKYLDLTPEHPSRIRLQTEVQKLTRDIENLQTQKYQETRQRLLNQYQANIYNRRLTEEAATQELKLQQAQSSHYANRYNAALALNRDIERATQQLSKINNRIDFLALESDAPGYVRLESLADPPLRSKSKRDQLLIIFLAATIACSLFAPIILDLLDRRIRTIGEVHKLMGFAPMAGLLDRQQKMAETLFTDQLRRLALMLIRDFHAHQSDCFALTSVKPEGGTTSLAFEIAKNLNFLGLRVMVLELNAFKPDKRYTDPQYPSVGLIGILNDPACYAPETQVIPANAELPARLPIGTTTERHITTYGRLENIVTALKKHYDFIILDTPPVLLSADIGLLPQIADGILLVIEANQIYPGELKRAAEIIERLEPPVVGTILNRIQLYKGGGYFQEILQEYNTGIKRRPNWLKRLLWR